MKEIQVPYGKGTQKAFVPDNIEFRYIDVEKKEILQNEEEMLKNAMDNPVNSKKLEELVTDDDDILIVVNDHTRPGPNQLIVKELLERLSKKTEKKKIKFIIATGSHRDPTEDELKNILGEKVVKDYEILIHHCKDEKNLVYVGESLYDIPIQVNKALTECSFCIVTGLIAPHHTAGFSGGRKSIVPGIAGFNTLKIHHSLPIRPFDPSMGFIYGNPFHEVALDVAKKTNTKFMVNAVHDPHKQNIAFVAGDLEEAHKKGVDICKKANEVVIEDKADLVIVSPGGYPRDSNLYQAQKALSVAETIGNKNCTYMLIAESQDGYGEGLFKEWLEEADNPEEVIERFKKEGYDVGTNKAFMYARAMMKGKVIIVSENFTKEELEKTMLGWAPNLQEALNVYLEEKTPNKIYVLPHAVNIIPKIKKEN